MSDRAATERGIAEKGCRKAAREGGAEERLGQTSFNHAVGRAYVVVIGLAAHKADAAIE